MAYAGLTNTIAAGLPTGSKRPVKESVPDAALMRNEVIESPFWLHEKISSREGLGIACALLAGFLLAG